MQLDPPPRVIFGPKDVERWTDELRAAYCLSSDACTFGEEDAWWNIGLPYSSGVYWKPTRAQVRRMERELTSALNRARSGLPYDVSYNAPRPLWQYSVQYIGYVREGEPLIYARGACEYEPDVREQWVNVLDGGWCFFGASFNPETGAFYGIGFNGPA